MKKKEKPMPVSSLYEVYVSLSLISTETHKMKLIIDGFLV